MRSPARYFTPGGGFRTDAQLIQHGRCDGRYVEDEGEAGGDVVQLVYDEGADGSLASTLNIARKKGYLLDDAAIAKAAEKKCVHGRCVSSYVGNLI